MMSLFCTYWEYRKGHLPQEIWGFVSILIKHCHFQNLMNVFYWAGQQENWNKFYY